MKFKIPLLLAGPSILFLMVKAWGGFYPAEIKNLQMELDSSKANIAWEKILLDFPELALTHNPHSQTFPRLGQSLVWDSENFQLKFTLPAVFPLAQVYSLPNFNLLSNAQQFELDLPLVQWTDTSGEPGIIKQLKMTGYDPRPMRYKNTDENMIDGFLAQSDMSFQLITLPQSKLYLVPGKNGEMSESLEFNQMENGSLKIRTGSFNFETKLIGVLKVNLSMEGVMVLDPSQRILNLRLDKAKAGILNVRELIFDELKKLKNSQLEIVPPYIKMKL